MPAQKQSALSEEMVHQRAQNKMIDNFRKEKNNLGFAHT